MSSSDTRTTTDHTAIQDWAKEHDAVPAAVRGTTDEASLGVLTFDVRGYGADETDLQHVEWDEWLQAFEDNGLAFVYQEQKASGEDSTFFRLVNRDTV